MPRKVRQLKAQLRKAGFVEDSRRGKGSHSYWHHPSGAYVVLSGADGDDAQSYQERDVKKAVAHARTGGA